MRRICQRGVLQSSAGWGRTSTTASLTIATRTWMRQMIPLCLATLRLESRPPFYRSTSMITGWNQRRSTAHWWASGRVCKARSGPNRRGRVATAIRRTEILSLFWRRAKSWGQPYKSHMSPPVRQPFLRIEVPISFRRVRRLGFVIPSKRHNSYRLCNDGRSARYDSYCVPAIVQAGRQAPHPTPPHPTPPLACDACSDVYACCVCGPAWLRSRLSGAR